MKKEFEILIADRNPHVREFLRREMTADGYRVRLAENGRELIKWVCHEKAPDLLILDPDLPDAEETDLIKKLQERIPYLPVVIHTFISDYAGYSEMLKAAVFVEKKGSSIERLKQVVADILEISNPGSESIRSPECVI
ncbi:MAG: hypothetical protein BWK80_60810 [Desulfobacteraceae bacterium IS3]|nr:MAG: hypothetical protein BWK80_60810 [Desulfobacteraceae bacterium IS3]